jgi:glucosamine--fructose-6-phosphate aminotransferase (isomerizing)
MTATSDEIASQPQTWEQALGIAADAAPVLGSPGERVLVLGCGTSAFMALAVAHARESAGLGETDWAYASELPDTRPYDRVVALSRSGTTTEVLEALDTFAGRARRTLVTAVDESPAAGHAEDVLVLDFADEASVVQTRFPTSLLVLARAAFGEDLSDLPDRCRAALGEPLPIAVGEIDHHVYLGRGGALGLAHEAALKIREAAQAWSESYPAMDFRHGPIAIAGPRSAVWILGAGSTGLVDDIRTTGATVVTGADDPLLQLVAAQRVAVALAEHRGLDPDRPRHLERSVILSEGAVA